MLLPALAIALVAAIWATVYWRVIHERTEAIKQAASDSEGFARTFEERTRRLLREIDQATRFVKFEFERRDARGEHIDLAEITHRKGLLSTDVTLRISIIDEHGDMVASDQPFKAVNVADRNHFKAHAERDSDELIISPPLFGRATQRWVVVASRRLNHANGSFAGVFQMSVDPAYFTGVYEPSVLLAHGFVALLGADGVFRAVRIGNQTSLDKTTDLAAFEAWAMAHQEGTALLESPFDGARRIFSYQRLVDFPLIAIAGISEEEALAGFYAQRRVYLGSAALASVFVVGLTALLMVQGLRLQTSRRNARQSAARLRMITDNMPALISYLDADQRFRFVNQAYRDWLGVEPDQLLGQSLREFYGADVYARIQPHIEVALAGRSVSYERELTATNGQRHVSTTMVPHCDEQGSVVGVFVMINDLTARWDAEQALSQSESRMRTVADAIPMPVAFVDADERLRFANLAWGRDFGLERSEILGKSLRELEGEARYRRLEPDIRRVLGGTLVCFETERARQGSTRQYEHTFIPQLGADGKTVLGFHSVSHDITAQKTEERRLLQLAQVDLLTGVSNRNGFEQALADAMSRSQASASLMALMYLDIDHFKRVNDTYGHLIGDALLKAFAGRLSHALRSTDVVARLGGDEFTIIMQGLVQPSDAAAVAAKIVRAMQVPFTLQQLSIDVTTSIGLALYQGAATTANALIKQADESLYEAKAAGRNNFRVTDSWVRTQTSPEVSTIAIR